MDGSAQIFLDDLSFVSSFRRHDAGGILYVEDFDAEPEPPPPAQAEMRSPILAEADIIAAREAGHAEGMQAALSDACVVQAQLQVAATQMLADALMNARVVLDRVANERAAATASLVLSVLQAAIPSVMMQHARVEADAVLQALLPGLRCEPELRVRTHPDLADLIRESLVTKLPADGAVLSVAADPALAPGDLQVAWRDGTAERNCAAIWDAIRGALASLDLPSLQEVCHGK